MDQVVTARYGIDPYLDWAAEEGVPITGGFSADLFKVQTAPWARYGVNGAIVNLEGRGDFSNVMLFEIPPGGATVPLQHLYEDVIYVLEGRGSTEIELPDGRKRSFEWGEKSLFSIPLNAKHRHYNAAGQHRALFATTTNLPLLLNAFHSPGFVFSNPYCFPERAGSDAFFEGQGNLITVRQGNHMWETNFVPSLDDLTLQALWRPRPRQHEHQDRAGRRLDARPCLRNEGWHLQERPPPRRRLPCVLRHGQRFLTCLV